MRIKTGEEKNKCFSSESRGLGKLMLTALGFVSLGYMVNDSIFYLDKEHDAIIVNKLWGEKRLVEEEGFHLKFPLIESKYLIYNLYDLDLLHLLANELKESVVLKPMHKFNLPSISQMMKIYEVSSKLELYKRVWNDVSSFLNYGITSQKLNKILTLYLENLVEKCKAIEPFLDENFDIINGHPNNKFFIEFHEASGYGKYEISTNTIKIPYLNVFQTFFYSLLASDPEFLKVGKIEHSEESLSYFYVKALIGETQLITALVHETIHAQSIMNESVVQALTHVALSEAAKVDKDFELYTKISIYLNLLDTLNLLKMKNTQQWENIDLPSRRIEEKFYGQYTIEWYKQIAMSLLTDNQLFIPEKKSTIDISSLKQYFTRLEELKS